MASFRASIDLKQNRYWDTLYSTCPYFDFLNTDLVLSETPWLSCLPSHAALYWKSLFPCTQSSSHDIDRCSQTVDSWQVPTPKSKSVQVAAKVTEWASLYVFVMNRKRRREVPARFGACNRSSHTSEPGMGRRDWKYKNRDIQQV